MHQHVVTDALMLFRALIERTGREHRFVDQIEPSRPGSPHVEHIYRLSDGHLELVTLSPSPSKWSRQKNSGWEFEIHFTGQSLVYAPSLTLIRGRGGSMRFTDEGWPLTGPHQNSNFHQFLSSNPFWRQYFRLERDRSLELGHAIELVLEYHETHRTDRAQRSLFDR